MMPIASNKLEPTELDVFEKSTDFRHLQTQTEQAASDVFFPVIDPVK